MKIGVVVVVKVVVRTGYGKAGRAAVGGPVAQRRPQFQRLKNKIKAKGAAWAVAHRVGKVIWLIMHEGVEYQERGEAVPNQRTLTRKLRKLVREFHSQGLGIRAQLNQALEVHA